MDKTLLVDDESAITGNLAPFLERSGLHVTVACDGQEALDQVARVSPDLIVVDVLMPRLDGREMLRRLRGAGDWRPVILLTLVGESTERAMALEEGADDYLNKPFDPSSVPLPLLPLFLCEPLCNFYDQHRPVTTCYGAVTSPPYPGNTRLV